MKYLADGFTLLRLALVLPLWACCQQQRWGLALLVLAAAWATDVADGPLARKFGSVLSHKLNLRNRFIDWDDIDDAADMILEHCALVIPLFYLFGLWRALLSVVVIEVVELCFWAISGPMDEDGLAMRRLVFVYDVVRMSSPVLAFGYLEYGWLGMALVMAGVISVATVYRTRTRPQRSADTNIHLVNGGETVVRA